MITAVGFRVGDETVVCATVRATLVDSRVSFTWIGVAEVEETPDQIDAVVDVAAKSGDEVLLAVAAERGELVFDHLRRAGFQPERRADSDLEAAFAFVKRLPAAPGGDRSVEAAGLAADALARHLGVVLAARGV